MLFVIRSPEQWRQLTLQVKSYLDLEKKMFNCYIQVSIVIPAMDSNEDDILIRLQFSNNLILPVPDSSHQMILEHQLLSHHLHDVLKQPEEDRVLALTERSSVLGFCLTFFPTYIEKPVFLIFLNVFHKFCIW